MANPSIIREFWEFLKSPEVEIAVLLNIALSLAIGLHLEIMGR